MVLRQLPGFAFRSPTDYANEMDKLHTIYDPVLGAGVVDTLERLQLFHVFSSIWFSVGLVVLILSIVACTIDRTPRLWRAERGDPRRPAGGLLRPEAAGPRPDRRRGARRTRPRVLRRHRFAVRQEVVDGTTYLYGDRNRWTKMATLLSHAGLVLFLVAAAVTSRLGDEQGLVVAEGQSMTVQPIGTPGLLLVRNLGFEAPGLETGHPTDFTTHLAVYQDGRQIADKVIRVNDPLAVAGYTFHQNGFGPAPGRGHPGRGGEAALDRAHPDDRRGGRLPVHRVRCPGEGRGAAAPAPEGGGRCGRAARPPVHARRARTPTARRRRSAWSRWR